MIFPNNCIKGIPNNTYLNERGFAASHLFYFKSPNSNSWQKQSVNWEDDEKAIDFTLEQRKVNGEKQFKAGVAVVERSAIDNLNDRPAVKNSLSYERDSLPDNRYHGNLILNSNALPRTMKMIAAGLALAVQRVVDQT